MNLKSNIPTYTYSGNVRISTGIILCRFNDNIPEVLTIQKRFSFGFADFVFGHYSGNVDERHILYLLSLMTTNELLDVKSLDFAQMWYRVWVIRNDKSDEYKKKKQRFETIFIHSDGGEYLLSLVNKAKASGDLQWELPKGRKHYGETDLSCAMREVKEETGISEKNYVLLHGVQKEVSFRDMNVRYIHRYFVALLVSEKYDTNNLYLSVGARDKIAEICQMKWMSINDMKVHHGESHMLVEMIRPIFNLIKRIKKNKRHTKVLQVT